MRKYFVYFKHHSAYTRHVDNMYYIWVFMILYKRLFLWGAEIGVLCVIMLSLCCHHVFTVSGMCLQQILWCMRCIVRETSRAVRSAMSQYLVAIWRSTLRRITSKSFVSCAVSKWNVVFWRITWLVVRYVLVACIFIWNKFGMSLCMCAYMCVVCVYSAIWKGQMNYYVTGQRRVDLWLLHNLKGHSW